MESRISEKHKSETKEIHGSSSDTHSKNEQSKKTEFVPSHIQVGGPPDQGAWGYLSYGSKRLDGSWKDSQSDVIIKRIEQNGNLVDCRQTPEGKRIPAHETPTAFGQAEKKS